MIYLGKKAATIKEGIEKSKAAIKDGSAFQKFREIVEEQGGDVRFIDAPETYPLATHIVDFKADKDGYISRLDAFSFGIAGLELGAGRKKKEDSIDPTAGITLLKKVGDRVSKGETIFRFHTNRPQVLDTVHNLIAKAVTISVIGPKLPQMVSHKIDKNGIMPFNL
jgi:pyrimidine-nucleoside phosphorylase